jgi:hypothetical protein
MMEQLAKLTSSTEVASWKPADSYANKILDASVCYGQLSGVITAIDYDLKACQGDTIQIRYVPARTAQGPKTACQCLSATSSTPGTYSVTVQQYGDYDDMCRFSFDVEACGDLKGKIMNEMAKGLAKKRDQVLWAEITTGFTPTWTSTLGHAWTAGVTTDGCCFNVVDVYNKIIYLQKQMQGGALSPDYVIMHPTVAAHFYYKDNGSMPQPSANMPLVKFDGKGQLISIAGMRVVECCNATSGTDVSGTTLAVVLDSSRAVGEGWGMRPTYSERYINECNYDKVVIWMYWGASEMDTNAIGHLLNP